MGDNIFNNTESSTPFFVGNPTGETVGELNERDDNSNMFAVSLLFVVGAVAILVTTVFCVIYRNKVDACLHKCGCGAPQKKQMMLHRQRRQRRMSSSTTESTSTTQPQSSSKIPFRNMNARSTREKTSLVDQQKQRRLKFVLQNLDLRLKGQHDLACHTCLVEFESSETVAYSQNPKCSHTFHPKCIVSWLSEHRGCPICQKSFFDTELEQSFRDQTPMCRVIQQSSKAQPQQQEGDVVDSHEKSESDKEISSSSLATRENIVVTNGVESAELNEDTGDDIERGTAVTVNNKTTETVAKSGASVTSSKASSSNHSHTSSNNTSSKHSYSSRQSEESSTSSSQKGTRQQRRRKRKTEQSSSPKSSEHSNGVQSGDAQASEHSRIELESTPSSQQTPSIETGISSDEEELSGIHSLISRKSATSKSSSSKHHRQKQKKHSKSTAGDAGGERGGEERDDVSAVSETLSKMLGPLFGSSSGSVSTRSSNKSKGKGTKRQSQIVYGTLLDKLDDDHSHSHYEEERDIFDEFMERGEFDSCSLDSCERESEDDDEDEEHRDDVSTASTVSESAQSAMSRLFAPIRMLGPFSSDDGDKSVNEQDRSLNYTLSIDEGDSVRGALGKEKQQQQHRQQNGVRNSINLTRKISGEANGFTTLIPLQYVSSIRKEQRKYHGAVYIPSTEEDGEMPSQYV